MFEKIGKAFAGTVSMLAIITLGSLASGFVPMLGMGAAHGWIHAIPTTGYWTSVLIAWATRTLLATNVNNK